MVIDNKDAAKNLDKLYVEDLTKYYEYLNRLKQNDNKVYRNSDGKHIVKMEMTDIFGGVFGDIFGKM
jgi:hypothetical protein